MTARVDRWRSRPRNFAIVLAACAAVFCLACWPWPTLYVVGTVAAAVILAAGVRLLATERRAPGGASRRHALAFNALSRTLAANDEFVRLSVRDAAARAVVEALDADDAERRARPCP